MAIIKGQTVSAHAGEDVKELEFSHTADGDVNWCSHCDNQSAVSQVAEHSHHTTQHFHFRTISKRHANLSPHKHLHTNVRSSILYKSQTWKQPKHLSTDEQNVA